MTTLDTDLRGGLGTSSGTPSQLRAALVSADAHVRQLVFESLQTAGIPVSLDLDLSVPAEGFDAEHLERLRASDPHIAIVDMAKDPVGAIRVAASIAAGNPRAALVGIGPTLEATTLLEAMRAGLVEYVPHPAESHDIAHALGRVMRKYGWTDSRDGDRNGKVMAFFAAKGGAGATTVVTNAGIELHRLTGRKTLLVDLDLELGEIASLMGLRPRFHFVDLVRNFHRMDAGLLPSYIEGHESGVHVLSAPVEPQYGEAVTGEQIAQILGFLRSHYDYVLVDASKSLAPPALAALQIADPIFLVTNLDVPSLRNLKRCLPILDKVTAGDADRLRLVVNRFNSKSLVGLQDFEETLGIEVSWALTNDYATVIQAISAGQPLVLRGKSRYAEELKNLARDVASGGRGASSEKSSLVGRLLSPFRSKSAQTPQERSLQNSTPVEALTHG